MFFCKHRKRVSVKLESEGKRRSGIISTSVDVYGNNDKDVITYPKTKEQEELLRRAIEKNEFLSNIVQGKRLQDSINCMYSKSVTAGEIVILEGEIGSHLYISDGGSYEILVHGNKIGSFYDVRVFGELAILYTSERSATVRATTNGTIWVLDCPTYKKLVIRSAIEEQEEIVSFLMNVPVLQTASKDKLYLVAKLFDTEFFLRDKEIVKQCELGDKFYIIRAGTVSVEKDGEQVAQLSKGQYFGELALLKDEFRQATVIANAPGAECLTLSRKEFIDHFGDVLEFVKLKAEPKKHFEKSIASTDLELKDLSVIQTIGMGAYGRVQLVQHTQQKNSVFALKFLKKTEISKLTHRNQVFNERNLHMSCNSSFITRMYRTYKDSKYLYFLLEACLGGDLWGLLHKQTKKVFDDKTARFYAGCVLEGISYLHDCGIIYRDLKPENVLVYHTGYLKLADFGFAKKIDNTETTYTFVGTAEYVAPEIIQNKGYNKSVDYWAFGIFIYELLVGRTPFRTSNHDHLTTYKLILKGIDEVIFPFHVPRKAKSLVKKLCRPHDSDRLGCQREGIDDIRNHKWFAGFDWEMLRKQEMDPPHKPRLLNITDTKYFEKYNDVDAPQDDFSDWDEAF